MYDYGEPDTEFPTSARDDYRRKYYEETSAQLIIAKRRYNLYFSLTFFLNNNLTVRLTWFPCFIQLKAIIHMQVGGWICIIYALAQYSSA